MAQSASQARLPFGASIRTSIKFNLWTQKFEVTREVLNAGRQEPVRKVCNRLELTSIGDMDINEAVERAERDPGREHQLPPRRRAPGKRGELRGYSL